MKIKTIGLLLSSSLILAACSGEDDDSANTDPEGAALTEQEASDEGEETSTEHGGTEQDAATEENTADEGEDNDEASDEETSADPSGANDPNTESEEDGESGSDENTESEGSSNEAGTDTCQSGNKTIALEDINLMASDALSIAEGEFEGDLHDISFEQENGEWVYKFDMKNGSEEAEVIINHETEEVVDVKTETDDDNDDDQDEVLDYGSLNEGYDAVDEAVADLGGGEVKEWSLSMDDGTPEYDIDLEYEGQTHEYTINAETLEILQSEKDD